ncbi:MAG: hypothetical protein C7B43_20925 [Sulfobacillus benefaciens]|uniref:Uncharacterized protein n=1 Tax=Sulfobacillus benefaciens TaxID=453960 RepID=A0A2T2WIP4_9FIRM|nr:MAG: hypothetical protein C7B43_20925 [Sulfobacillus benefaciens]
MFRAREWLQTTVKGNAGDSWINLTHTYNNCGTAYMGAHAYYGTIDGGWFTVSYSDGASASGSVNFWPWQASPTWKNSDSQTFPGSGWYSATLTGQADTMLSSGGSEIATFLNPTSWCYE